LPRDMGTNLVIVESPAKAKTIERYLGAGYRVLASYGHVRDLPENPGKDSLGVDVDHDFAPQYEVVADRRRQLGAIDRAARTADAVYLATDLDREGEAIAWHVAEAIDLPPEKARRVTFSEITEPAIRAAFAHPRSIDRHLVDAQQARRVVDRLVGYTLSPLLWRKVRAGLSAGRVQSVAVRLVVDREREIRAFVAREYWTLAALLEARGGATFSAELVRVDGKKPEIADEATARHHTEAIRAGRPLVRSVGIRRSSRNPAPPFTTSTLQQEASRKLGFSPKRTMSVAQRLYEGVETGEGQVGLITYMRTDSVALSGQAMGEARDVIRARFGDQYAMPRGRTYKTRTRNAQEAHEAIRPTSFGRDPEAMARQLGRDEARLYRLIWQRALASQMAPKDLETTTVDLATGPYELRASATRTVFDGFARVYTEGRDEDAEDEQDATLPPLAEGDATSVVDVVPTQHFTEPPPRYTEATLIKALEDNGIGRPSTYAATISTIVDRGYVKVKERRLHPEPVGEIVTDLLVDNFGDFVDLGFTARMEEDLDEVARGDRSWVPVVRDFYTPFRSLVDSKRRELRRADYTTRPTDEVCSEGHPMVIRLGRYGEFLACSLYPEHKETRPLPGSEEAIAAGSGNGTGQPATAPALPGVGETCPECGATEGGTLVAKRGRFGAFVGCSRYPDCRYIHKDGPPAPEQLPFEVVCPTCREGHLVARRARRTGSVFWGCSRYPKCKGTVSLEPVGAVHDADDGPVARATDGTGRCLGCGAPIDLQAAGEPLVGRRLPGGEPDPSALARPARRSGGRRAGSGRGTGRGGPSRSTRRVRQTADA
ncbi:MAG TPA: type I DNA topoisomerase, partial [Candidatus Dormibacteraeota bacterium]|nr:type I DNA topoisomerase [Candidatus Dormibacteraeota bacterium]